MLYRVFALATLFFLLYLCICHLNPLASLSFPPFSPPPFCIISFIDLLLQLPPYVYLSFLSVNHRFYPFQLCISITTNSNISYLILQANHLYHTEITFLMIKRGIQRERLVESGYAGVLQQYDVKLYYQPSIIIHDVSVITHYTFNCSVWFTTRAVKGTPTTCI